MRDECEGREVYCRVVISDFVYSKCMYLKWHMKLRNDTWVYSVHIRES